MEKLSEKVFLLLKMPTEETPESDQNRIRLALEVLGYAPVHFPLPALRKLYPLCRVSDFDITVTLVRTDTRWVITDVEAGDTRRHHYGLAVNYGSTTIIMQLVDLNTGAIICEEQAVNFTDCLRHGYFDPDYLFPGASRSRGASAAIHRRNL